MLREAEGHYKAGYSKNRGKTVSVVSTCFNSLKIYQKES